MKKILVILLVAFLLLTMIGCSSKKDASDNSDKSTAAITMIPLGYIKNSNKSNFGKLCFDNFTKIVYITSNNTYPGISPYLAPNGQPYTYDEATRSLIPLPSYLNEEIPEEWIIKLANKE